MGDFNQPAHRFVYPQISCCDHILFVEDSWVKTAKLNTWLRMRIVAAGAWGQQAVASVWDIEKSGKAKSLQEIEREELEKAQRVSACFVPRLFSCMA